MIADETLLTAIRACRGAVALGGRLRPLRRPNGICPPPIRPTIRTRENLVAFAKDVEAATGGKLQDHGPSERLAVQGAGDQARGADRPGADGRGAALDPRERGSAVRHRRGAVPGDELSGGDEALQGVEAGDREEARRAGHHAAVRGAVGAAGHLRQEGPQLDRRHEGPEVARLQCRHRAHRRTRRRAVGDDPGGRAAAGARDRRRQLVHVVGRHRLRHQGLGDADALLRRAGVDSEELHLRQQGGVRRARQADAGRDPEGRRHRRDARLEGVGGQDQLVSRPAQGQGHEGAAAERRARRPASRRSATS